MSIELSVCIIVKNEALLLDRCLKSILPASDEIIVVDTGSTDGTQEVVVKNGAKLIQSDWKNDFSYSRNISLDAANGNWILWLDADDVVPEDSIPKIIELKKQTPDKVLGFTIKNEKQSNTGAEFIQARMFPNNPKIRFERPIHEQMMPSALRLGLELVNVPVVIEHHGYADGLALEKKAQRNVDLLLKEYPSIAPDAVSAIEIADSYTILRNDNNAYKWYNIVLDIDNVEITMPEIASQAHYGLGNIANTQERFTDGEYHFSKAIELCSSRTDAMYCLSVSLEMNGKISEAEKILKNIIGMKVPAVVIGINFRETELKAVLRLGRILRENNKKEALLSHINESVKAFPERPEVYNMSALSFIILGDLMKALHLYEKSLEIAIEGNIDAYIGLCSIYIKAHKRDLAIETMTKIHDIFSSFPRYWAFRTIINMDGEVPATIDRKLLDKEIKFLKSI